jgi:MoxR-like ATPase
MGNLANEKEAIDYLAQLNRDLKAEIGKVIVGQDAVIHQVLLSIFSNGHVLLVGVPGLAKTLLVNTISRVLGLSFNRIQFTPDLMPGDIVGNEIFTANKTFEFIKGPVFTNILLADEINRTPPKTQAALLECMQEKSITYAGKTYQIQQPFFVLATQNPVEQEGTYPLPEAQLDRFMLNVWVDYPSYAEELEVVKRTTGTSVADLNSFSGAEEILALQSNIRSMPVSDAVLEYAVKLAVNTRPATNAPEITNKYLEWGAGPRASQYLILGAKTNAALSGKYSPDIEDVKAVAEPVLRHRIMKNYHADADSVSVESIIQELL